MIDSPKVRIITVPQRCHPLVAIAEMQAEIIRRNRARDGDGDVEGCIRLVNLQKIERRLGVKLRLTTHQEAIELGKKRLDALMWIAGRCGTSVKRRLLFDRVFRQHFANRQALKLAVVK